MGKWRAYTAEEISKVFRHASTTVLAAYGLAGGDYDEAFVLFADGTVGFPCSLESSTENFFAAAEHFQRCAPTVKVKS